MNTETVDLRTVPTVELTGSDKQITWAETIRAEKLKEVRLEIKRIWKACNQALPQHQEGYRELQAVYTDLCNVAEAKFWIDNRSEFGSSIMRSHGNALRAARA